jgi:23S rRNA (guanosine2251-2'-O)-methyltransferase
MIVYGRNPVREAIRGRRTVRRIWATKHAVHEPWLEEAGVPVHAADPDELERRCGSADHQGICAEVSGFIYAHAAALLGAGPGVILALDQVQDPQNLGAICRTAECAGVRGVVIPERRAAEVTPAVCKSSAGAVEHLPVARVRNLADFLLEAKRAGLWCYGARAGAESTYDRVDYADAAVLVVGSEGSGLRPRVASACDLLVSIPLRGQIESLNVSSAAAVLVYAATQGPWPSVGGPDLEAHLA